MWGLSIQFWQNVVWIASVVALVGGVGAGASLYVSSWVSSSIADQVQADADRRISEAQARGDEAQAEAAKANERANVAAERAATLEKAAAELQLQVEEAKKLAGPRNIRGKDQDHIKAALESFRGTPYDLSFPPIGDHASLLAPSLLEPGSFLIDHLIVTLSRLSGWELRSVEGNIPKAPLPAGPASLSLDSTTFTDGQKVAIPLICVGQITGVAGVKILHPKNPKLVDPAYALARALNDVGVWTDVDLPVPHNNIAADMITTDAIHIVVGTKP